MTKREFVAAAAGALAASALAGGVAWAAIPDSGGVIQGCYNNGGNLKVVSELPCPKGWTSLQWNQEGPKGDPGTAGISPSVTPLSQGDANCPGGGAALTDADGTTAYVCNGTNGQPFAGTFTSPNGDYSISVTDAGITLSSGQNTFVELVGDDLTVHSLGDLGLVSDQGVSLQAGASANVVAGTDVSLLGNDVAVHSQGDFDLLTDQGVVVHAGTSVNVLAETDFSLKGAGSGLVQSAGVLWLKGSAVNIN